MKTAFQIILLTIVMFILQIPTIAQSSVTRIFSMAWNPEGTVLAIGGIFEDQRALRIIDQNGTIVREINVNSGPGGVSWHPEGTQIASYSSGQYTIWDVSTGTELVSLSRMGAASDDFTYWNPANYNQITTVATDVVYLRDVNTGEIQATLADLDARWDSVLSVGWSPNGTTLYVVSNDSFIRMWDVSTGMLANEIPLEVGPYASAMSPDRTRFAISGSDRMVHIFDSATATLLSSFGGLPEVPTRSPILHLVWNPDGTQIAGYDSEGIHAWDVETGQLLVTVPHSSELRSQTGFTYAPTGALTYPGDNPDNLILLAPIARAATDQTLTDSDDTGSEPVTLDGSGSDDSDGTIVRYVWSEDSVVIATGADPQVDLAVGEHIITLIVTDDDGATGGDVVVITVEAPSAVN